MSKVISRAKKITVALSQPLMIADKEFTEITVREPIANDLRGISITQLQMSEGDAVLSVLERVTDIHEENLQRLSVSDFSTLSNVILGFLFPKQMQNILEGIKQGGSEITIA
ncbi:phage tail assembly protein [Ignatzschineria rhizosphaerae]|uniref:Phage tail assembly protein n=1 Tax=Ignatzschineria rhizosphaerae TaxID=2923279 RepID=A0ABY3X396_9GAMM|nr:phage tail assembly protein [Ignatzschineria rhizosphaerae]UNM96740.1 phage tail assembly protein [Ignatzschineria rhizosphaerae]